MLAGVCILCWPHHWLLLPILVSAIVFAGLVGAGVFHAGPLINGGGGATPLERRASYLD